MLKLVARVCELRESLVIAAVTREYGIDRSPELMLLASKKAPEPLKRERFRLRSAAGVTYSLMILLCSRAKAFWSLRARNFSPRSSSVPFFQ